MGGSPGELPRLGHEVRQVLEGSRSLGPAGEGAALTFPRPCASPGTQAWESDLRKWLGGRFPLFCRTGRKLLTVHSNRSLIQNNNSNTMMDDAAILHRGQRFPFLPVWTRRPFLWPLSWQPWDVHEGQSGMGAGQGVWGSSGLDPPLALGG